ncbi:MAG: hypothetical protein LBR07_05235 [Puniceicoccales bacterium]|jgi:hypothetical protein|nr:hypothetical protein [Puniceicoccales bacterium]
MTTKTFLAIAAGAIALAFAAAGGAMLSLGTIGRWLNDASLPAWPRAVAEWDERIGCALLAIGLAGNIITLIALALRRAE